MKKIFIPVVALGLFLSSCGSSITADQAADQYCSLMDKMQKVTNMEEMKKYQSEIESVSAAAKSVPEDQLISALEKKCPETATLVKRLMKK